MMILVTGFEPFGGETLNPSWEAVKRLPDTTGGACIARLQVPTTYAGCIGAVTGAIDRLSPHAVVMVGQAGGRAELSIERVAVNLDDTQAPDNAGVILQSTPIVPQGPAAYFATLPVKEIVAGLHAAGYPAVVSNTAGLFVCNHLMYGVLDHIAVNHLAAQAGFIHVPFLPEQVAERPGTPSMSLDLMSAALQTVVDILAGR
ncbi:MAG: pyroglutamyl-peptidase I [Candidatus Cryosericum sp.]